MRATKSAELRLSTTSYVVLGIIALRGPSTSYDLKRAVGHSVGYFWSFPHAQLYAEPTRLAKAGLLDLEQENIGRRRKIYSITEDGMAALRKWLAEPVGEPFQLRNAAEIKLLFSELAQADEIVELAREQVRLHEERMDEYEAIVQRFSDDESVATRLVPLELGIQLERTALEFWRGLAEGQKAAPPTEKQTGRP